MTQQAIAYQPEVVREVELTPKRPEPEGLALVVQRLAENPAVDVEKLERIILLQERIDQHHAKAAFDAAFAAMQAELPVIAERGKTDKARYATLEDIVEQIRPVLAKYHFSLTHRTEWPDDKRVKVIGILAHERGHERSSEFLTLADTSGSKNAIQALGSALSYGRRYTTLDLLNIVSRWSDDDGSKTTPKAAAAPEGLEAFWDDLNAVADEGLDKLRAFWALPQYETLRSFVLKHRAPAWANLKARAEKVKA